MIETVEKWDFVRRKKKEIIITKKKKIILIEIYSSSTMRRYLDGHVVDLPDFRLCLHPGCVGHPVRQVYREVISLSEETRPRVGRVVNLHKLESSAQQL